MPIDFTKPVKLDNYDTGLLASIRTHIVALACQLDPADAGTVTSTPTGARRWIVGGLPERFNGTSWAEMATGFLKPSGNAATATALATARLIGGTSFNGTADIAVALASSVPWAGISSNPFSAPVTFGSIAVSGVTAGYYGVQFTDSAKKWTFMVNVVGDSGLYSVTDLTWKWLFNNSGELAAGSVPWDRISGKPVDRGTYTPTITQLINVASAVINQTFTWMKVGNVVTAFGRLTFTTDGFADSSRSAAISLPPGMPGIEGGSLLSGSGVCNTPNGSLQIARIFVGVSGTTVLALISTVGLNPAGATMAMNINFQYLTSTAP